MSLLYLLERLSELSYLVFDPTLLKVYFSLSTLHLVQKFLVMQFLDLDGINNPLQKHFILDGPDLFFVPDVTALILLVSTRNTHAHG